MKNVIRGANPRINRSSEKSERLREANRTEPPWPRERERESGNERLQMVCIAITCEGRVTGNSRLLGLG